MDSRHSEQLPKGQLLIHPDLRLQRGCRTVFVLVNAHVALNPFLSLRVSHSTRSEHAAGEQCLETLGARKPTFQLLLAVRKRSQNDCRFYWKSPPGVLCRLANQWWAVLPGLDLHGAHQAGGHHLRVERAVG